jgi:hypothetical protein
MTAVSHSYLLGKDQTFSFGSAIVNKDVKSVTVTSETSAEGEVTTRGSGDMQEFVPIRKNTTIEVVVLNHSCAHHRHETVSITGQLGSSYAGTYYVNNISEPQEIDGVVETTISLRKYAASAGTGA